MVEYIVAGGDVESSPEENVAVKEKSSLEWTLGLLFLLALALGVILLFPWYTNRSEIQSSHLSVLTEDSVEKTDLHFTLQQVSSKTKVAIHLEGSYDTENESSRAMFQWKNGQGQAFAQGGLKLVNNQIVIPQNGLYFVYSQASFRVSCIDGHYLGRAAEMVTPLSHRVWRYSDSIGVRVSMMCAIRSACPSAAQEDHFIDLQGWYNVIYLGAVFHLNKGDKLWTETNQLLDLETEEGKTFFGVFAL